MFELLDSSGFRLLGYGAAAAACVVAAWGDHRGRTRDPWPSFWMLAATLVSAMGVARGLDLGDAASDWARGRAIADGWYLDRGAVQALLILVLGGAWIVGIGFALWRIRARWPRYLAPAVVVISLAGFAAVRAVSFHYVDAVLYRRGLGPLRFVSVVELSLLAAMVVTTRWSPLGAAFQAETDPAQMAGTAVDTRDQAEPAS